MSVHNRLTAKTANIDKLYIAGGSAGQVLTRQSDGSAEFQDPTAGAVNSGWVSFNMDLRTASGASGFVSEVVAQGRAYWESRLTPDGDYLFTIHPNPNPTLVTVNAGGHNLVITAPAFTPELLINTIAIYNGEVGDFGSFLSVNSATDSIRWDFDGTASSQNLSFRFPVFTARHPNPTIADP